MNEARALPEAVTSQEAITTELLAEEGNYRIEIEGTELQERPQFVPADTGALVEAAEAEAIATLAAMSMVEFVFEPPAEIITTPLELLPPTTTASAATTQPTPNPLRGEVARAYSIEFEIQRSHG